MVVQNLSTLWKLRKLVTQPRKMIRVFRDARTPLLAKLLPLATVAYILFPLDFLPDFIPILGQIDDLTVIVTVVSYVVRIIPDEVFRDAGLEHSGDQ